MAITIYDIAARVGFSHTAVSAALNGREVKAGIGPEAAKKIRAMALKMGYRKDPLAHAVVSGKTKIIGVITANPEKEFIGKILRGALIAATRRGYLLRILSLLDEADFTLGKAFDQCLEYRAAGVYCCGIGLEDLPARDRRKGRWKMPEKLCVAHTHCFPDLGGVRLDSDDVQGARLGVLHLLSLGHRRIAFLAGPPGNPSSDERLDGYRQAMAVAGVTVPKACIQHGNWLLDQTAEATRRLLSQTPRPTAIFCANDPMAAVVVQVATAMGYAVPQRLSVLGFSDHVIAQFVVPQLTTVAQPYRAVGQQAIEMLADVAEGKRDPSDMRPALLPTRLVIRASTAAPTETFSA